MKSGRILKRLIASRSLRVAWCIFFVLNTVLLVAFGQVFAYLQSNGFYKDDGAKLAESIDSALVEKYSYDAIRYLGLVVADSANERNIFFQSESIQKEYKALKNSLNAQNTNFRYLCTSDKKAYSNLPVEQGQEKEKVVRTVSARAVLSEKKRTAVFNKEHNFAYEVFNPNVWSFNAYVVKDLKAHDEFWRVERFFFYANQVKYILVILLSFFSMIEALLMYYICRFAGRRGDSDKLETSAIDHVPIYLVLLLYIPAYVLSVYYLLSQSSHLLMTRAVLANYETYTRDLSAESRPALLIYGVLVVFIALLTLTFFQTLSVRIKAASRNPGKGKDFRSRAKSALLILTVVQILAIPLIYLAFMMNGKSESMQMMWMGYLFSEIGFSAALGILIYITGKNASVMLLGTHRIAFRRRGIIPTEGLAGQFRAHVENINFLSHAASAETEKRFINESFSTKLINGISGSLRAPLSDVGATIEKLETENLSPEQEKICVQALNVLSQNLKKTIEDLIRISKATTGNLEAHISETEAGMLLDQFAGEYSGMFRKKDIDLMVEHPQEPVMFNADGQFMWYIFDGIFKLLLEKVIPGTRVFMTMKNVNNTVLILFHCCVKVNDEDSEAIFNADSGLGLPTAKVFTELQGGTIRYTCRQDMLNIALRFPQVTKEETPKNE